VAHLSSVARVKTHPDQVSNLSGGWPAILAQRRLTRTISPSLTSDKAAHYALLAWFAERTSAQGLYALALEETPK
jgi:hypothetical protein